MRNSVWTLAAVASLLTGATGPGRAQGDGMTAQLPGWMAGCWVTDAEGDARNEECWTQPRGTMMLGSGHTFDTRKSLAFEHMRIVHEDGTIAFVAQPGGGAATRFSLERQVAPGGTAPALISFVNAAHDYPQRVTYRLANGTLEAETALLDGSRPMRWTFRRTEAPER